MSSALSVARTSFDLPDERHATAPPEARGLERDGVRLLVADGDALHHARFRDLADFLSPGDLVVVNTSATLAAAVDAIGSGGRPAIVHFSSPAPASSAADLWIVEARGPDGPLAGARTGDAFHLPGGGSLELVNAHPASRTNESRLWLARFSARSASQSRSQRPQSVEDYLARFGRPIFYGYVHEVWPLSAYQTVFAREPGSAEMPSAARPFTDRLVTELVVRGIRIAPVLLHAGVSSLEAGEPPQTERFSVHATTARLVNETRRMGGRVIAIGTTVTRALESAVGSDGIVEAREGVTDLVLGPLRPTRVVDGLVTGWHEPKASHLALLEAVAGPELVQRAYDEALTAGYLWHEFGDSCLLLPKRAGARKLQRIG